MGEYERFEKIRTNLKESKIIRESRTESENNRENFTESKRIRENSLYETQHELIDTGREPEKNVVGGLGVFNTSKLTLEKQEIS